MKKLIAALLVAALCAVWMPGTVSAQENSAGTELPVMDSFEVSYEDWAMEYVSLHPGEIKAIIADAPEYWKDFGFASLEEFLTSEGISREEYTITWEAYDYLMELYLEAVHTFAQEARSRWIGDVREYLGAPRSGLAVMLNDKYVSFTDAQPEISDGRTMIPIRALMETMGAEVSYDSDDKGSLVTVLIDGTQFKFNIGSSTLYVTRDGVSKTLEMDCSTYIKSDRTYVPIRFFSEALGYDVMWDDNFETAVILDKSSIITQLNMDFTLFNRLLAAVSGDKGSGDGMRKTVADFTAAITQFSTLDGDTQTQISGNVTVISDGLTQQISMKLDFSRIIELFLAQFDQSMPPELMEKLSGLNHISADLILNLDEGVMYLHYPELMKLMGVEPADAWIMAEISPDNLPELPFETPELLTSFGDAASMGEYIYFSMTGSTGDFSVPCYFPALLYNDIVSAGAKLKRVCGDSTFSTLGGTANWQMDRDTYEMLNYGELPASELDYDYKELNISISISDFSGIECKFALRPNTSYSADYRISGSLSMLGQHAQINLELHTNNVMKLNLSISANTSESSQPPATKPPEGSTVLTPDQLTPPVAS